MQFAIGPPAEQEVESRCSPLVLITRSGSGMQAYSRKETRLLGGDFVGVQRTGAAAAGRWVGCGPCDLVSSTVS